MSVSVTKLNFMVGRWQGQLGEQTVEEAWSEPHAGCISTMVRLAGPSSLDLIELISICETEDSLMLYLRQFSPELDLRLSQAMQMIELTENSVTFECTSESHLMKLTYRRPSSSTFEVDVTFAEGTTVTAQLQSAP